jgi:hypothetical protein
MKLKKFNEFFDLGRDQIWGGGKVGQDLAYKVKASAAKKLPKPNYDSSYKARDAAHQRIAKIVKPNDLPKHTVKPLSDQKRHADYTVHHVKGEEGSYASALLHHKTKGFVGLLNGTKYKDGFHVSESFISPVHRGKGLGVALYDHTATHHKGIVSDSSLSHHSQKVYAHFAKEGRLTAHVPDGMSKDRTYTNLDRGHKVKHGDLVSVKKEAPPRARVSKKKVADKLKFQTIGADDLSRTAGVRLRIEPKSNKSK